METSSFEYDFACRQLRRRRRVARRNTLCNGVIIFSPTGRSSNASAAQLELKTPTCPSERNDFLISFREGEGEPQLVWSVIKFNLPSRSYKATAEGEGEGSLRMYKTKQKIPASLRYTPSRVVLMQVIALFQVCLLLLRTPQSRGRKWNGGT